jgi:hypothetical protein
LRFDGGLSDRVNPPLAGRSTGFDQVNPRLSIIHNNEQNRINLKYRVDIGLSLDYLNSLGVISISEIIDFLQIPQMAEAAVELSSERIGSAVTHQKLL